VKLATKIRRENIFANSIADLMNIYAYTNTKEKGRK
jgi:hypothetical protein